MSPAPLVVRDAGTEEPNCISFLSVGLSSQLIYDFILHFWLSIQNWDSLAALVCCLFLHCSLNPCGLCWGTRSIAQEPTGHAAKSRAAHIAHCLAPMQRWRESFVTLPSICFVIMLLQVALEINQWHNVLWRKNRSPNHGSPWQLDLKPKLASCLSYTRLSWSTEITLPFACSISTSATN